MNQISFQKVLQTSTTQNVQLGAVAYTPDGRVWRYVKANEAVTPIGSICTRVADTAVTNITSTATNSRSETVYITESGWAQTAGDFQNAYGVVSAGTGVGQFFVVKDNSADTLELYSDYAIATALDTTSDLTLARPYLVRECVVTTLNQIPSGVAQVTFAANDYGYLLIQGMGSIRMGDAGVANEQITPGDDTAGTALAIANGETPDDVSTFGRLIVAAESADVATMAWIDLW